MRTSLPLGSVRLQWGRGHLTAESCLHFHMRRAFKEPSMGPRSFDRGEADADLGEIAVAPPSMGPRSFDRGESAVWMSFAFSGASLQWGRGHLTAESRPHGPTGHTGWHTFNGAAVI